jgi:putative ABC transport system permease protein
VKLLDLAIKNILRVKTRTGLTIFGIVIGITAIVALGSISEGIKARINEQLEFLGGTIMVSSKGSGSLMMGFMGSEISKNRVEELESIPNVKEVIPIIVQIEVETIGQQGKIIVGIDPNKVDYFKGKGIELEFGRTIQEGDTYSANLGYTFAKTNNLVVGDTIKLKNENFEVVGTFEESGSTIDNMIIVPIDTLMDVYDMENYKALYVIPEDISRIDDLAEDIEDEFDDLSAQTTKEMAEQASQIVNTIQIFTIGIAGISVVVGGLGVMNTMIMSIMERKKEIGIMKAIGATNKFILNQILLESVMITLIGGILGILFGSIGSYSLRFFSETFTHVKVTLNLILISLIFALSLGILGGIYPAWKAVKLNPIEAIRYE